MSEQYRFVVVANRLPVDEIVDGDGKREWTRSPGGLVSALQPTVRARQGGWIGWAGGTGQAPDPFSFDGMWLHPIALSAEDLDYYYEGESNASIWPLYHDAVETPTFHRHWRESYRRVNRRFAEAAAELAAPGAVVWVHDYQLQLVPAMLRELRPDLRIGFFLHIPFPPVELFMQLPWRTQLLEGLLGADLVGFQRPGGAENFLRLTRTLLGLEPEGDHVMVDGRRVTARAFPISIDVDEMEKLAADPHIRQRAKQLGEELGGHRRLLLGVDRLDYTKGIEHRLKAYRELLAEGRLSNQEVALVQVATPSRLRVAQYRQLRERVEREVGRINGEYGQVGLAPVHYLFRSYDRDELLALYLAADVMVVTPLRDGMNLIAKEYVSARTDNTGALVLSEFTGAAAELPEAFLVNPHDVDGLKEAFTAALETPGPELSARMRRMREHVCDHDVTRWAKEYLEALGEVGACP
ncbi:MAG TPA: trehalose-6-phosphate synthase [Actinoplanes sp.]|nr:trehalose-6-phosphate synthase [Actinoplanes sp.]